MQLKFEETCKFLRLVNSDTDQREFFQTFSDKKDGLGPFSAYDDIGTLHARLQYENERGSCIAMCINRTDGNGRSNDHIVQIRAVWHDHDKADEQPPEFPLTPTFVVETSKGKFHSYWIVNEDWSADDKGRLDFARIMHQMVGRFGSDANAKDLSRVLRVPGFFNQKAEPYPVRIVEVSGRTYTRKQLLEGFAPPQLQGPIRLTNNALDALARGHAEAAESNEAEIDRARSVLQSIPADNRNDWLTVGMALHQATQGSEAGFLIWEDWSKASSKYNDKEQHRAWRSFNERPDRLVTLASVFALAKRYQRTLQTKEGKQGVPLPLKPNALTKVALDCVRRKFLERGTNPSVDEWDGLEQIALAVQGMADGTLPAKFYLSALAPGVGKTSVICEAIRQHKDQSAIVFLYRCEEIERLIADMGLSESEYAVIVSNKGEYAALNKLGNPDPTKARVLFTTQQRLQMYSEGKAFADIAPFHFHDKPRQIRVWDEAIMPSTELTLNYYDMLRLIKGCAENAPALAEELEAHCALIKDLPKREQTGVALFLQNLEGVSLEDFQSWHPETDKHAAEAMWRMNKHALRWKQDHHGNTVLRYENILPNDLAPMLILDASGLQRETYALWAANRGGLELLPSPPKNYSPLVIHHWDRASGKSTSVDWNSLADGVAKTISELPEDDKILVVHHLKSKYVPDIKGMIEERTNRKVAYCTWGKHTATNEFRDCKHVILAGILQYPTSVIEARGRGAKGSRPFDEFLDEEHRETRLGEIAHNILQAACRGALRRSEGNHCPEGCTLWVIFSSRPVTGIPQGLLKRVFAGATIYQWRPIIRLKGNAKRLADLLLKMPLGGWPMAFVQTELGIMDRRNIQRLLKGRDMGEWMEQQGIRLTTGRDLRFERIGATDAHQAVDKKNGLIELPY